MACGLEIYSSQVNHGIATQKTSITRNLQILGQRKGEMSAGVHAEEGLCKLVRDDNHTQRVTSKI